MNRTIVPNKNKLASYNISLDIITKLSERDIALMSDRNNLATSGTPWEFWF